MGLGDSIRMGFSDAVKWASDTAEAGAKMVGEAISSATDTVVKTAESVIAPAKAASTEAPKPASLATTVQGVNSSLADKVAYGWKKTTELTSTLGSYAAMLTPGGAALTAASKLVNLGNNTYQNKENGDQIKILANNTSITSVLKDSAWQSAINKSGDGKETAEANPSIDTAKLIDTLPAAQQDNGSFRACRRSESTQHVDRDQWKRILSDSNCASVVPDATVSKDSITFGASEAATETSEAEVKVGQDKLVRATKDGKVEFNAKAQHLVSRSEAGVTVDVNRATREVQALDNGKGYRVEGDKKIWDVNDGKTVELGPDGVYRIYDRSHNLVQELTKEKIVDIRGRDRIYRYATGKIREELNQLNEQRTAPPSGREIGAASDGIFLRDTDGTTVVLQTDGNAFFELNGGVKIWKNVNDKYFIIEDGKEPQAILDGSSGKAVEDQAREYLGHLKNWANQNTFTRDGVKFTNVGGRIDVEMDDGKTSLQAGTTALVLNTPDSPTSTFNTLTKKFTLGQGADQTTIDLACDTVETPWVKTDKFGTTIKSSGDWIGHDLEVKLADGTHWTKEGDVKFADGTIFHSTGEVTLASNVRLAADIQEQQIKQAATVLRNAEAVAETAKAKAASGLIDYSMIAQLDGSISQVAALMQMFAGNDAIRARLGMVMASLQAARNDAVDSFQSNTALRATRDAALASNKVKPESIALASGYNPELKMQYRFKIDRSAA